MRTYGVSREFSCWIKLSKRASARELNMREAVRGGIQGTWAEDAGVCPEQHFLTGKKLIEILGRIAQCKCVMSHPLNNVGGNGRRTVPVCSKVRDDRGFLSHSTFGLVLIFTFVNLCHFCYSDLLRL